MATAANTKATPTNETPEPVQVHEATQIPEPVHTIREQVLTGVKQGQQLSVDAAQGWAKAVSALPVPDLPKIPGMPAVPSIETMTKFSFDTATELLNNQRDFALKLTHVLAPAKIS